MVTQVTQIPIPPVPTDPPGAFNQKASDVFDGLYQAIPQINQVANEIEQIGADAELAKLRAISEADAAMGYRNSASASSASASASASAAHLDKEAAEVAAEDAIEAKDAAEAAAQQAENRVPWTGPDGVAILPACKVADLVIADLPATGLLVTQDTDSGFPVWFDRVLGQWKRLDPAGVAAKVAALEAAKAESMFIYPNGGSVAAPANAGPNQQYIESNPYHGFDVICVPEILISGKWRNPNWDGNTGTGSVAYGVCAGIAYDIGSIVIQTGASGIANWSNITGGLHGINSGTIPTSAPIRIRVIKTGATL